MPKRYVALLIAFLAVLSFGRPLSAHDPNQIPDLVERVRTAVVSVSVVTNTPAGDQKAKSEAKKKTASAPPNFKDLPKDHPLNKFFKDLYKKQKAKSADTKTGVTKTGKGGSGKSQGSGFIIAPNGYIITAGHLITDAKEVSIRLSDGSAHSAVIVGTDARTDIAVLKINAKSELPALKLGQSGEVRLGEQVIVIGSPFGLGGSVTSGIVSAKGRDIGSGPYDFIQVDAAINRGNAGGPLFNLRGEVIGMNTAIYSPSGGSVGIGFAVPSDLVRRVSQMLMQSGSVRRGWLGVKIQSVTDELASAIGLDSTYGALVSEVTAGGPADKGGLKVSDAIVEVNGNKIPNSRGLARQIAAIAPGEPAKIVLYRKGKRQTLMVKLGTFPTQVPAGASGRRAPAAATSLEVLGMKLSRLDDALKKKYKVAKDTTSGMIVTRVAKGSTARDKGIRAGHVLREIGGAAVSSPGDVAQRFAAIKASGRKAALLLVESGKVTRFVALPIANLRPEDLRLGGDNRSEAVKKLDKLE